MKKLCCMLIVLLMDWVSVPAYDHHLSLVTIFQNEAPYLQEWIEYHRLIGIEHFYLYNHLSTDHYQEVLEPYIEQGVVELVDWPFVCTSYKEWDNTQINAYIDCLKRALHKSRWLAIIDTDEFIVPISTNHLGQFLKKFESLKVGGICLIWSFFGTSNVEKIPEDKLLIETLILHSGPANGGNVRDIWNHGAYKSIVQPEYVVQMHSPHYCIYAKGYSHSMMEYNKIHINHYWTRDEYYLINHKIPRRENWGITDRNTCLDWARNMNVYKDNNPILRFVPALRELMNLSK